MKTVIEMARESGAIRIHERPKEFAVVGNEAIERFAELVRADEQKKWQDQTAVETHEAILGERAACAKVCEELVPNMSRIGNEASVWDVATFDCAEAIRTRSQA